MYHLKLCKGLSYYGVIQATKKNPDVFVEDKEIADKVMKSGYFKMVGTDEKNISVEKAHLDREQLEVMRLDDLKKLAEDMEIDTSGLKKKSDFINAITSDDENVNEIDFDENNPE